MYIPLDLLWKIIYIALSVIHLIVYFIIFYKLHKLNIKPDILSTLKEKITSLGKGLLKVFGVDLDNISSVLEKFKQIKTKPQDEEDKTDNG